MLFVLVASVLAAVNLVIAQDNTVILGPVATALDTAATTATSVDFTVPEILLPTDGGFTSETLASATNIGAASTTLATSSRSTASRTTQASTTQSQTSPSATISGTTALTEAQKSAIKTGAIVGGVLGGLAMVCIAAVAIVWIMRRRPSKPKDKALRNSGFVDLPEVGAPPEYAGQYGNEGPIELDGGKVDTVRELGGAPVVVELPAIKK
ncbi:hypothetical protein BDV96DRAFT_644526 [Lophiotrema nucula]|uniref:Mid2 domain-containing protein n=1 Tax=Lophiotrema nucula TaxID=690887 RepID=A0A6A5ZDU3_9PLEO|nr:hypothetical protein BDV96DRAFT_644526 [Lophiotrema nucula]